MKRTQNGKQKIKITSTKIASIVAGRYCTIKSSSFETKGDARVKTAKIHVKKNHALLYSFLEGSKLGRLFSPASRRDLLSISMKKDVVGLWGIGVVRISQLAISCCSYTEFFLGDKNS